MLPGWRCWSCTCMWHRKWKMRRTRVSGRWCCLIEGDKKREGGCREQIKCCNECAVILAVLISLFVYFSSHLPRHAVPQCFPSSLVRSHCCALMHVLGWCSCPVRFFCLFVFAAQCLCARVCVLCVRARWHIFFLLIKLPRWSDTSRVSANSSCFWPFCRTCEHAQHANRRAASHAHMSTQAGDGWCYYLKLLRGRKVLKRANTPDCLCFIIRN